MICDHVSFFILDAFQVPESCLGCARRLCAHLFDIGPRAKHALLPGRHSCELFCCDSLVECFLSQLFPIQLDVDWQDFEKQDGCVPLVKQAFAEMEDTFQRGDYATLNSKFELCDPISDEAGEQKHRTNI